MTDDEQVQICKVMAAACMWGQGGIASVILEGLNKKVPLARSWVAVYRENAETAKKEHMGVLSDEEELRRYLGRGYWLTNGDSLFNPPPMNGLCTYVSPELYTKYAPTY